VGLIIAGIKINNKMGGDLIILLESLSATLRESLRARSRKDNLTLQSRLSANIISFFPIAALLFLYIFYSSSILDFFSTTAGTVVLVAGGLLEIIGILFMKRILRG
jgi:tight adherence protein B